MATAIVIVPASFTPPEMYTLLESALQDNGFQTRTVDLPSVGTRESGKKPGTMLEDAAQISSAVDELYKDPKVKEVVVMAHSYGGIPASESMKDASTKNRSAQGKKGVSRIIYFAAIVLPVGVSNNEMRKRPIPDSVIIDPDWITINHMEDATIAFNDLPEEEALVWAAKGQQQSTVSFQERASYAGYADVEVHYIRCTNDKVLPLEGYQRILAVIEEASQQAPKIYEFPSGHDPMVSKPRELAELVTQILA